MNLPKAYKNRLKAYEPLRRHTTFRIGGKGRWWFEPKDARELVSFLKDTNKTLSCFVIGNGSNLLIKDGILRKAFIRLSSAAFTHIAVKDCIVTAGAGVPLSRLVSFLNSKNISGYEFLAGIPGTLGGALAMNAGARMDWYDAASYRAMDDIVLEADVIDSAGRIKKIKKSKIKFSYRSSSLKRTIILSARLKLRKASHGKAKKIVCDILKERYKHQDWRYPGAGSIFKNPAQGLSAGRLIDLCGLKGCCVGGACVSLKHANFIINRNRAKSGDVIKLMEKIRKIVYNRFKIKLQPEVEIVS